MFRMTSKLFSSLPCQLLFAKFLRTFQISSSREFISQLFAIFVEEDRWISRRSLSLACRLCRFLKFYNGWWNENTAISRDWSMSSESFKGSHSFHSIKLEVWYCGWTCVIANIWYKGKLIHGIQNILLAEYVTSRPGIASATVYNRPKNLNVLAWHIESHLPCLLITFREQFRQIYLELWNFASQSIGIQFNRIKIPCR